MMICVMLSEAKHLQRCPRTNPMHRAGTAIPFRTSPHVFTVALLVASPNAPAFGQVLPPAPNFQREVDYIDWHEKASRKGIKKNAYPLYGAFMPGFIGGEADVSKWPVAFDGVLARRQPIPWSPDEHKEWEAVYTQTQGALKQFARTAQSGEIVTPPGVPRGNDTVDGLLLRARMQHLIGLEQCAKATLNAAWRATDGLPPADAFIDAVSNNLMMANQFHRSLFFREQRFAASIRRLTYQHVLWALAHGVVDEKAAARLGKRLDKIDADAIDFSTAVSGEAAKTLESLQYIFGPPQQGRMQATVNSSRYQDVTGSMALGGGRIGFGQGLKADGPRAAKAFADAFKSLATVFQPPYSTDEIGKVTGIEAKARQVDKVAGEILTEGTCQAAYEDAMQTESWRRAARLMTELHAYKGRKGHWPKKFASLSKKLRARCGDDPFGEGTFQYQLTAAGPFLYSVGRNERDDSGLHDARLGFSGDSGDFVFWPIPDGAKLIAAVRLRAMKETAGEPFNAITADRAGQTVTFFAQVTKTRSMPSKQHGQLFEVTLKQGDHELILLYDEATSKALGQHQQIAAAALIRAVCTIKNQDEGLRLWLRDADWVLVDDRLPE